jgi:YHS domain-containing protein
MWRLIVLAVLLVIVYFLVRSVVRGFFQKRQEVARAQSTGTPSELVQDPVCGMFVPKEGAYFIRNADRTHFFCGESCRDIYEKKLSSA